MPSRARTPAVRHSVAPNATPPQQQQQQQHGAGSVLLQTARTIDFPSVVSAKKTTARTQQPWAAALHRFAWCCSLALTVCAVWHAVSPWGAGGTAGHCLPVWWNTALPTAAAAAAASWRAPPGIVQRVGTWMWQCIQAGAAQAVWRAVNLLPVLYQGCSLLVTRVPWLILDTGSEDNAPIFLPVLSSRWVLGAATVASVASLAAQAAATRWALPDAGGWRRAQWLAWLLTAASTSSSRTPHTLAWGGGDALDVCPTLPTCNIMGAAAASFAAAAALVAVCLHAFDTILEFMVATATPDMQFADWLRTHVPHLLPPVKAS